MFKKYIFDSNIPGLKCLILGAVHGDETAGTIAQRRIIKQLETGRLNLKSGKVTFIPIVNEAAYRLRARFVDVNLNRVVCFHPTPQNNEEKIADKLTKEIDDCDIMLDLHSTHCPEDKAFAFIDYPQPDNLNLLSVMPVKTALAGWPAIYTGGVIDNFCTEAYAHIRNKIGITIECGYHHAPQATNIAEQAILNLLSFYHIINAPKPAVQQQRIITLDSFIIKQFSGHLNRNFKHLDKIKSGEILAVYDNGSSLKAPADGYIIMPNPKAVVGTEWFYLGH